MAFDLVHHPSKPAVMPGFRWPAKRWHGPAASCDSVLRWRQSVLEIACDCLSQIEAVKDGQPASIWRQEARQRLVNFASLSAAELLPDVAARRRAPAFAANATAAATLAGAYRVLSRCCGEKPVQCENILRSFVKNLALTYAPANGHWQVDLQTCPIFLRQFECRAMIFSIGALLQVLISNTPDKSHGRRLMLDLSRETTPEHRLVLELGGSQAEIGGTAEYALACRMSGIFRAELSHAATPDRGAKIALNFPRLSSLAAEPEDQRAAAELYKA